MGDLPHEHYLAQSGYQIDPKPEPSNFSGLRLSARGPHQIRAPYAGPFL